MFKYKRLSDISISHRYNLCKSKTYSRVRKHFKKTCAKRSSSGERRKLTWRSAPAIFALAGSVKAIRAALKGVYPINALMKSRSLKSCVLPKRSVSNKNPRGKPSCLTLDFLVSLESKAFNRNFIHPLFAPRGGE